MNESPNGGAFPLGTRVSLSIILAAYREGENLALLLPAISAVAQEITPSWEVLVVDTQLPTDDTPAVCAANGVRHIARRGGNDYGDAIRTGISESRGDYVVIMDADGSHNPDFIRRLWAARNDADLVIASRYVVGGDTDNPWLLVGLSRLLNLTFRALVGLPALDISNSFRLYQGPMLRDLHLTFRHFDVLEEILAKLVWQRMPPVRVLEVPYRFERRIKGRSKRSLLIFGIHFCLAAIRLSSMRRRFIMERSSG